MKLTAPPQEDEGYDMPCAEAMLAGTLALMTGHAESQCAQHKALMARKVVSHLFFLASYPALNPNFRTVMARMHAHWAALLAVSGDTALSRQVSVADAWGAAPGQWH